jgi:hypothetical protein
MHPGSCVSWGCSAPHVILPWLPELCQNDSLSVLSWIKETGKSRVGAGWQSSWFWSKVPYWKRKCEKVRCRDAAASSFVTKVRGEVFEHFNAVVIKRHSSMRNWLFNYHDEFFMDIKENDEHSLGFDLHLSLLFRSRWVWIFRVWLVLSSPNACLIIGKVSVAIFPRFSQNLMLFFFGSIEK